MADTMNERESNLSFDFWAAGSELATLIIEDVFFFFHQDSCFISIHIHCFSLGSLESQPG